MVSDLYILTFVCYRASHESGGQAWPGASADALFQEQARKQVDDVAFGSQRTTGRVYNTIHIFDQTGH
jgi:hypothetical protein